MATYLQLHQQQFLSTGGRAETWETEYWKIFKRLPNTTLTPEVAIETLNAIDASTRTRQRAYTAIKSLCKLAGIKVDLSSLRGTYKPSSVGVRNVPTDELIAENYWAIQQPGWRWVYGMMATYGLRNHEVFKLDLERFPIVQVLEDTKTGFREVWPCYPEWADEWNLGNPIFPNIELNRTNTRIGTRVSIYLSPKLPFLPYDLRHAWAIRTIHFGWPDTLAAAQMGHSLDVHNRTYHRWISSRDHQKVYELLVMRPDRPRPPTVTRPSM